MTMVKKGGTIPAVPALMAAMATVCGLLALAGHGLDDPRLSRAMLALCVFLAFCAVVLGRHQRRMRARAASLAALRGDAEEALLLAYASQTGYAEQLAWQTAQTLQAGAMPVRLAGLDAVDGEQLARTRRALFVVSTTGDGDPPDSVEEFTRSVMRQPLDLRELRYGLLALGDRGYARYCAFGRGLEEWLRQQGAQPLFDSVEVDNASADDLNLWQQRLALLGAPGGTSAWQAPRYQRWILSERRLLNPGSPGAPAFHLALRPVDGELRWQAGDIVDIGPLNAADQVAGWLSRLDLPGTAPVDLDGQRLSLEQALRDRLLRHDEASLAALRGLEAQSVVERLAPLPQRTYSIASLPGDGQIELLVRRMRHPDGSLGIGSGWLTEHAEIGGEIALRVRENRSFHPPQDDSPLILIGSGTGLAGLRAHLKARAARGHHRNWLLFGERTARHDFFHGEEILRWQDQGVLQRLDLAFSRDQTPRLYVQEKLLAAQAELRDWVARGAAIYVCGSLEGMASGVAGALQATLGAAQLESLRRAGKYRRDVY